MFDFYFPSSIFSSLKIPCSANKWTAVLDKLHKSQKSQWMMKKFSHFYSCYFVPSPGSVVYIFLSVQCFFFVRFFFLPCQERGVSVLTEALEQCLTVRWGEGYEVLSDSTASPISKETSQEVIEILKTLFNIAHRFHRHKPNEVTPWKHANQLCISQIQTVLPELIHPGLLVV